MPSSRRRAVLVTPAAFAAGAVAAVLAAYLAVGARDESRLREANELGARGDLAGALRVSRSVTRAPAGTRARLAEAYAALQLGRTGDALRAFADAARRDPENWVVHRDWAVALAQAGQAERARRRMARAAQLNPRLRLGADFP